MKKPTKNMIRVLGIVTRFERDGGGWYRSQDAGERVTLAYLETNGYLARRAWRGDGVNRNSAFEYRLSDVMRAEMERRRLLDRVAGVVAEVTT